MKHTQKENQWLIYAVRDMCKYQCIDRCVYATSDDYRVFSLSIYSIQKKQCIKHHRKYNDKTLPMALEKRKIHTLHK